MGINQKLNAGTNSSAIYQTNMQAFIIEQQGIKWRNEDTNDPKEH